MYDPDADNVSTILNLNSAMPHRYPLQPNGLANMLVGGVNFDASEGKIVAAAVARDRADACVVTNVPGRPVSMYATGAKLESMYGLICLTEGMGLAHTVQSYVEEPAVAFTACRELMPDPDLARFGPVSREERADRKHRGVRQPHRPWRKPVSHGDPRRPAGSTRWGVEAFRGDRDY
jgi:hypothetical protein